MKAFFPMRSLFLQIVVMTVLGVLAGVFTPHAAQHFKLLSDVFLKLISMIVSPLVFCVIVQGMQGAGTIRTVGRLGSKALLYFEAMTTVALGVGLLAAVTLHPGTGLSLPQQDLSQAAQQAHQQASALKTGGVDAFILHLIPKNPADAFVHNDVMQVLVFALIFGCALLLAGEQAAPVTRLVQALSTIFFRIMGIIVRFAPLGVFGGISYTISHYGLGSIEPLLRFLFVYFLAVILFVGLILGGLLRLYCGVNIISLLLYLREEMSIVLATTSSDAVLPQIMQKLIDMGVGRKTVGIVIPAGYSFNLDALSIYLGLSILFLAQVAQVTLSWPQLLLVIGMALITSKGAHGVPGVAIVILAATVSLVPEIPTVGLVLLVSVDWFVGIARAFGNIVGNCAAAIVVATWEKDIDLQHVRKTLVHASTSENTRQTNTHTLKNISNDDIGGE
ncbi:cation:dicarboxylase symporter family transporter [Acetobacter senegalensis]|nr:cation:dicarboxylase symporter family transporter [Acetobacter senegalensis]MCG4266172.1 cation:dicarboxylase symporter family transporter [Acetobacter senegalensis]